MFDRERIKREREDNRRKRLTEQSAQQAQEQVEQTFLTKELAPMLIEFVRVAKSTGLRAIRFRNGNRWLKETGWIIQLSVDEYGSSTVWIIDRLGQVWQGGKNNGYFATRTSLAWFHQMMTLYTAEVGRGKFDDDTLQFYVALMENALADPWG